MSADQDLLPPGGNNPFPATPVAPVQGFDAQTITIDTPAIREAVGHLSHYLGTDRSEQDGDSPPAGNVIAIVGDYGTGKTHLTMHLLWQARRAVDRTVHAMYVDAPADSFLSLYRERFIPKLRRSDVKQRVQDYYADIVADSLEGVEFAAGITQRLRSREVDPRQVVERMGLMEGSLLRDLQNRLRDVTRNDAYGIALTLLLRPGFETAVWDWLSGHSPERILQERGVTSVIETEADALEAIGVFAILYGSQDHRFILVIDELEKVLSGSRQFTESPAQAFKKLLMVSSQSGTFLVLSGLPDFLQALDADVRQRIGPVIRTSPLTPIDVSRYIKDTMERVSGERRLTPFTQEIVAYLTTLAGGNARRIMQLCHHAYRLSAGKSSINHTMVSKAAREQFEFLTADDMRAEVRRVLDIRGWPINQDHMPGQAHESRIDYWVPVGSEEAGCAVLLTDSVLYDDDVNVLARRVQAVNAAVPTARILLVVNGYLNPNQVDRLNAMLTDPPLVYDSRRFTDDFDAALLAVTRRLEKSTGKDDLDIIRDRMERLTQMQSRTQNFLEQLPAFLDATRSSSDRRFSAIETALEGLLARAPRSGTAGRHHPDLSVELPAPPLLPTPVERLFERALTSLDDLERLNDLLSEAFSPGDEQTSHAARTALFRRFGVEDAFYSTGVAVLLQGLVNAFRDAVTRWYRTLGHGPTEAQQQYFAFLCQSYDALYEYLPVFRLDSLNQFSARPLDREDQISRSTRSSRRANIREALENLGARVRTAMLESLGP